MTGRLAALVAGMLLSGVFPIAAATADTDGQPVPVAHVEQGWALPVSQLTFDVDVLSLTVTYARRLGSVLVGGGIGIGPSPVFGTIRARSAHYSGSPNTMLLEFAQVQLFARLEPLTWVKVDGGVRGGGFIHGSENFSGGEFAAVYLAPFVGWRWFWIGPRLSAGLLAERGEETTGAVSIDYLSARVALAW